MSPTKAGIYLSISMLLVWAGVLEVWAERPDWRAATLTVLYAAANAIVFLWR